MSVQRVKVKFMKWKYNAVAETEDQEEPMSQPLIINTTAASSGGGVTRVVENNVYFYGDITESNALELNTVLYELDRKLAVTGLFIESNPVIKLHINSYGGSLFAGLATVDVIRNLNSEVHSYIEGAAASAATIISVACAKRYIGKYSKM